MLEEEISKVKALFPNDIETIVISKNDYDRLYGDMTLENIELKQEIERLKDLVKQLWNNNKSSNLNEEQKELLNSTIFGSDKE